MSKNQTYLNPKSANVLEKWLDGNKIYNTNHFRNFQFGPETSGQRHLTLDFDKMGNWVINPSKFLETWDSFEETMYDDEYRMNTVTRSVIVVFTLLILAGVRNWIIVLIVGLFVILILWYTLIPSSQGSMDCKKPHNPKIQYLRCQKPKPKPKPKSKSKSLNKDIRYKKSYTLFRPIEKSPLAYILHPKNRKSI